MTDRIEFFRVSDEYGCFLNSSRHTVVFKKRTWKTSEAAFQAQKFPDNPELQEKIWLASTPSEAARIGRDRSNPLRADWETLYQTPIGEAICAVKDSCMFEVLMAKFTQHDELCKKLLSTGDAYLVENTSSTGDAYWGETSPGVGKNKLGHLLMLVRTILPTL